MPSTTYLILSAPERREGARLEGRNGAGAMLSRSLMAAGRRFRTLAAVAGLVCAGALVGPAGAGEIQAQTAGLYFRAPVVSLREARFQTVYRQQLDFSCGSAALASLLTFHYELRTSEQEALLAMWEGGDQEKIRRLGFSLLDMKKYLASRGLRADGFEASLDDLRKAGLPAIVLLNINNYKHFVVIKGIRDDEVLVGDPAFGVNIMPRAKFEASWNGILFVIRQQVEVGRKNFNLERDWGVRGKAPFGTALGRNQGLSTFAMLLPGRNEF